MAIALFFCSIFKYLHLSLQGGLHSMFTAEQLFYIPIISHFVVTIVSCMFFKLKKGIPLFEKIEPVKRLQVPAILSSTIIFSKFGIGSHFSHVLSIYLNFILMRFKIRNNFIKRK